MSVRVMSMVYDATIGDIKYKKSGKTRTAKASTCKSILLAIADNANDFGESAYPGLATIARKTEFSQQAVIDTIAALESAKYLTVNRRGSRLGTNDYKVNVELLGSQATLPVVVKPLDQGSQVALHEPSVNHQLNTHGAETAPRANFEPNPKTPKLGDIMDGMLAFDAERILNELEQTINQYPNELQPTLKRCAAVLGWSAGMIPKPPAKNTKRAGAYGLWVSELRELRDILTDVDPDRVLEDARKKATGFSVARPGSFIGFVRPVAGEYIRAMTRTADFMEQSSALTSAPVQAANVDALAKLQNRFANRSDV